MPSEMERARAARALLVDAKRPGVKDEPMELAAFMEIFHPGHPATDEMVAEAERRRGGRRKVRRAR